MDYNRKVLRNADNSVEVNRYNKRIKEGAILLLLFALWLFAFILSGRSMVYFALSLVYVGMSWIRIHFVKGNRKKSIQFFKISFLGYTAFILFMSILLKISAGDTNSILSGASNILNTMFMASSILIPLGLIGVQANEFMHLFNGKNKTLEEDIDDIKHQSNRGM